MQDIYQKTLSKIISFEGIGLHSGQKTKINLLPAKSNHGIVFKRIDLKKNNLIRANYLNVSSAKLCTTLENDHGVKVSTVEHLLAAFYLVGVDNAIVEVDNEEVPIMDGSSKMFLDSLNNSKLKVLEEKRKFLRVSNKIELIDGDRTISIEPDNETLEVEFQLDYKNKIIGKQKNTINFKNDNTNDVSESRTFCLYKDIEKIKKAGLAKGGSLENAVVVGDEKVLNKDGLRNKKEFVNHKILDLVGDFLLSGHRILGKVKCYQGGHQLTNMFLRKLMKSKHSISSIKLNETVAFKKEIQDPATKIALNA